MNDRKSRFGQILPIILFVCIFVICIAVTSMVFIESLDRSYEAEYMNSCVQLARNEAEFIRSCEDINLIPAGILYFDENFNESMKEDATYYLEIDKMEEKTESGTLSTCDISSYTIDGTKYYGLTVVKFNNMEVTYYGG